MENYTRIIPRDMFNEAKLLKCMGVVALKILDRMLPEGVTIHIEESGQPFDIVQLSDGELTIINYPVLVNGLEMVFKTAYNSKDNYPLYFEYGDYEQERVLDERGEFTSEFIEIAHTLTV